MAKLTPEQLAKIANRCEKATPGEWKVSNANKSDAEFITASRTDIPALLDHIKALEEENARYKEALGKYANEENWNSVHEDPMYSDWWTKDSNGYEIAQDVLAKGADEE